MNETTSRREQWIDKSQPGDQRIAGVVRVLEGEAELAEVRPGDLVLLGICNDRGVIENGGRAGAADGPLALRRALGKLSASVLGERRLFDAGDLGPALSQDYERMFLLGAEVVRAALRREANVIVVGGGHDCAFATYRGLVGAGLRPTVVNVDAHLDVRPTHGPSSGNPFFRMLEDGLDDLTEVGLLGAINSAEHVAYARARGAHLQFFDPPATELEQLAVAQEAMIRGHAHQRALHLSIDLDAIQAAHAPGVSWLNPVGLSPATVRTLARMAGQYGARALDLMELSPPLDVGGESGRDGVTARLAALLIADFCAGLDTRTPTAAPSR